MKIIKKSFKIENIAEHWKVKYPKNTRLFGGKTSDEIYNLLLNLNPKTEKGIKKIIGNASWTRNNCDECKKDADLLIEIGQEPDYESSTAQICIKCLQKAVTLLKNK